MKALLIALMLTFSSQAFALNIDPELLSDQQRAEILNVLNQLEPEVLDRLLSEEGMDWYSSQFSRFDGEDSLTAGEHSRMDFAGNPFEDKDAPRFN